MEAVMAWSGMAAVPAQAIVWAYGAAALHFWTQRAMYARGGLKDEYGFYARLLRKFAGNLAEVREDAQGLVHERRRADLQEIASLWSLVLDIFILILFVVQVASLAPPMNGSLSFFTTVSLGSTVMRRMGRPGADLTPERLNRDMTIMSLLVFGATLGMPRELMPACYMARMLCFTFTNSQVSNKVNLLLAPFYVVSHWINQTPESPREGILFAMIGEVVAVSLMILVITNLDTKEHDSAIATLELAEKVREVEAAEREGGAAQRLLAVTCDAFVRLTSDLKIRTPSPSFLHLLMCDFGSNSAALDGTPFLRYIAPSDHQRFADFLSESSKSTHRAGSLHLDMKDSSNVTFSVELYHVTVPSAISLEDEHLIGISHGPSDDVVRKDTSPQEKLPTLLHEPKYGDMRHILGYQIGRPDASQAHSKRSKSSRSSSHSSRSSRQADLKLMHALQKFSLVVDLETVEHDFMIREVKLEFASSKDVSDDLLPNVMEWLKPNHRKPVNDWIQAHANAHFAGNGKQEPDLRGVKLISPFPNTSTLLAAQLTSGGIIEEPLEDEQAATPAASHTTDATSMYLVMEFTKLYIH